MKLLCMTAKAHQMTKKAPKCLTENKEKPSNLVPDMCDGSDQDHSHHDRNT